MDGEAGSQTSIRITEPKLVIVEGKEEEVFFSALQAYLGLINVQILNYGGKDNLRPFLRTLVMLSGFNHVTSLAVVRDADSSAHDALRSIQGSLRTAELPVPQQPLVPAGSSPRVITMVVPHGADNGMLEDVCLQAVASDPAMGCVEEYFQCVRGRVTELPQNMSKAKVHAFLSSRLQPDLRLGEAAQRGYWPWDAQTFNPVKQLLQML